jgi:small multidrug resistance family-3 protein
MSALRAQGQGVASERAGRGTPFEAANHQVGTGRGNRQLTDVITKSLLFLIAAGICEIGGGYLVWLWLRKGRSPWLAVVGAIVLFAYGVLPTFQPANFGRVYAAYGGIFIVLSILWGLGVDGTRPDRFDLIGGLIAWLERPSSCIGRGGDAFGVWSREIRHWG